MKNISSTLTRSQNTFKIKSTKTPHCNLHKSVHSFRATAPRSQSTNLRVSSQTPNNVRHIHSSTFNLCKITYSKVQYKPNTPRDPRSFPKEPRLPSKPNPPRRSQFKLSNNTPRSPANDIQSVQDFISNKNRTSSIDFSFTLKTCAATKDLNLAKQLHNSAIERNIEFTTVNWNNLVIMYSKCNGLKEAVDALTQMQQKGIKPDTSTWNELIEAHVNEGRRALELFQQMVHDGAQPNDSIFTSVLRALNQSSLADEALKFFERMTSEFHFNPHLVHENLVEEVLMKTGRTEDAKQFVEKNKKNFSLFTAKPSATHSHRSPSITGKQLEVKDRSQNTINEEEREQIKEKKKQLRAALKEAGFKADTSWVLHNIDDELQKEDLLWEHSERSAVAFGLIKTPPKSPLMIKKNLRICGDCHNAFKYISKVEEREITVRDNNRFHVFKDGKCSCNDYY